MWRYSVSTGLLAQLERHAVALIADAELRTRAGAEALKTEMEETRRGAWTNHLLAEAARRDPTAPLNVGALTAAIPSHGLLR